jgi:plasmid stabilization system protein ParE
MSENSYKLLLRDHATLELKEAYSWYEEQQQGLGEEFIKSIGEKLDKITNNPQHYKKTYKNYREALADRFPFLIVYIANETAKEILVVAIFHTSRNPKVKYRNRS